MYLKQKHYLPIIGGTITDSRSSGGRCAFKLYWEANKSVLQHTNKTRKIRMQRTYWILDARTGLGCAYLEHVHGVVCVGQTEQQAVEYLLPAQLAHFSVTREQRQYLKKKRGTNNDNGYRYLVLILLVLWYRIRLDYIFQENFKILSKYWKLWQLWR